MALQYINVGEKDFGRGIDARSTENQIGEGFVRDLLNADVIQKSVRKRTGYESYAGNIPVRVTRLDYIAVGDTKQMCLTLDSGAALDSTVSLESVRSSPILVYGKTSTFATGTGPITQVDSIKYYDKFIVPIRKVFLASETVYNIAGSEHGLATTDFFCNVVKSTDAVNKSYEDVDVTNITINTNTYDVAINYKLQDVAAIDAIVYYKNQATSPGDNYTTSLSHDGTPISQQFTIQTTNHNLSNFNIIHQLYQLSGTEYIQCKPDKFELFSNGDVRVTISNDTGATVIYKLILSTCPTQNSVEDQIEGSTLNSTVVLPQVTSPWIFYSIYLQDPITLLKEEVQANFVNYDDSTKDVTISFDNEGPDARTVLVYYQYGSIRSNILCVDDSSVTLSGTDPLPQLTIWGLDHNEIYTTKAGREGWTTHIDTYRRSAEQRVIAGLGGNLFAAREYGEVGSQYNYPVLYPYLQSRTSTVQTVGPVFYDTEDTPARTRGHITTSIGGTGWVRATGVQYDTSNGWTKYTLSAPDMDVQGTPISFTAGLEDWLTVNNMSYKRHEGTFRIKNVVYGTNQIEVWVENLNNTSSDWDDPKAPSTSGPGGYAGVFTDQLTWSANCSYIPQDTLILGSSDLAAVYSSSLTTTVCGPFNEARSIAAGVLITARRTSEVVPLRTGLPEGDSSVENLVRGDMLSYTGLDRNIRVLNINAGPDLVVSSLSADGTSVTLTVSDTSYLSEGQKIVLLNAGSYTGVQTVDSVIDNQTVTFLSSIQETVAAGTAILSGKTVELDENLQWKDTVGDQAGFFVPRRWIPIEAPADMYNLTPTTYVRHFDADGYSDQSFIRSTMVSDNLYLTNGRDEVMKFDGQSIYRAGLPAWQPALFANKQTNPTSRSCTFTSGLATVSTASTAGLLIGALVSEATSPSLIIPAGARIVSINSATQFTISAVALSSGSVTTNFTISRIAVPAPRTISYTGLTANGDDRKAGQIPIDVKYMNTIPEGTEIIVDGDPTPYTVRRYEDKSTGGSSSHALLLDRALPASASSVTTSGTISEVLGYYRYYFRLNAIDANDNRIGSAFTSSQDMTVRMTENAAICLRLVGLPALDNYDYNRIEIEIYRTKLLSVSALTDPVPPTFYKIVTLGGTTNPSVNFNRTTGYIEYIDTQADSNLLLGDVDRLSVLAGSELGRGWSDPLRAKYITSTNNRLVLGNVRDYPEFNIQLLGPANLGSSTFNNGTLMFRKDSLDVGPLTNMTDRVKFQWKAGFTGNANSFTVGTNTFSFVTSIATGAQEGDWIYLAHDTSVINPDLKYSGWWQIKQVSGTAVTVNLMGATVASNYPNKYVIATDPTDVPVYLGPDGNLGQINGDSAGTESDTFDTTRRLALAINSVMRMVDTSLSGMSGFRPWMVSRSGNDVPTAGNIVVRVPQQLSTLPSITVNYNESQYTVYVNDEALASTGSREARERAFPSRIIVSYLNYPEIFDNPAELDDRNSISAIDVNSADGQEITGVIPFFGEAAFTAAQQAGILVVFKTNSIYLVDINQKVSGSNVIVQRLETQGLGCTAPYSIAPTKSGIMFANTSGIYRLRRDQAIEYVGKYMERNWTEKVDRSALSIAQGHHYGSGRMYKLSVPILETENPDTGYLEPSQVYVYNHTQEEEGQLGAWSRYDNHTAIGWANLASDAFWASTGGKVYLLRATGTVSDFRDSNEPIVFRLDTRPNDYGNSGIRKVLDKVIVSYRAGTDTASNKLYFSVDTEQEYSATTPFNIAGTAKNLNGIDDLVQQDVVTLRHSLDRRKGIYFSVRIENSNLDQKVEVAGVDYRIGGLDSKGIKSASKT